MENSEGKGMPVLLEKLMQATKTYSLLLLSDANATEITQAAYNIALIQADINQIKQKETNNLPQHDLPLATVEPRS